METIIPSSREIIRGSFLKRGIPDAAIPILIDSISKATFKQYAGTYKKWWLFCQRNKVDIYQANVGNIIAFLNDLFLNKASYTTLNTHRSALSLILNYSNGDEILIKRFLKGVYRAKPCFPKYKTTWDPQPVLEYLKKLYPLNTLSLEMLTKKLASLLLLATGQRLQTISKIKIQNIHGIESSKIKIFITEILKTSSYNRQQPVLEFNYFTECPELCVANKLKAYLLRTSSLRKDTDEYLMLTFKKPHHIASSQTIGRWIKKILKISGIDTNKYHSHNTRHATTSAAFRKGIGIDQIKDTIGWSQSSQVFQKFYNRPLEGNKLNFVELIQGNN